MPELFRKKALEKLRSPEQLDQLLRITSTRSWLALLGVVIIVVTAILWGIYGRVATKVAGIGIFLDAGGVFDVVATGEGRLVDIKVGINDRVRTGQVVATLVTPDLAEQVAVKEAQLAALINDSKKLEQALKAETKTKKKVLQKQRENTLEEIKVQQESLKFYEEQIDAYTELYKKGLVLKRQVISLQLKRDETLLQMAQARNQLGKISTEELAIDEDVREQLFKSQFQIDNVKGEVDVLREKAKQTVEVVSKFAGTVVGIQGSVGKIVGQGQSILSVELTDSTIGVDLYVKAFQGKKVRPNMIMQITPSTVKRDEYGFMLAKVTYVSDFPETSQSMMRVLDNQDLVDSLLKQGPLTSIKGELITDPSTKSGFKWSSRKGKSITITTGTLGQGEVVVREQAPIVLVIPLLKRFLGV
jgi:HlyD family secretion protein